MLTAEREVLVVENIKLTHHIAKKYFHPYLDHDDLVSIGTIGLINAAKTFDESKGYKFSSLAYKAIEREIIKEIIKFSRAKRNGIVYSFEDHIAVNLTIGDTIFDTKNFEREIVNSLSLYKALKQLTLKEQLVVIYYFGLFENEPLNQKTIASLLGVTQTIVSRILRKALLKLRKCIEGGILK